MPLLIHYLKILHLTSYIPKASLISAISLFNCSTSFTMFVRLLANPALSLPAIRDCEGLLVGGTNVSELMVFQPWNLTLPS